MYIIEGKSTFKFFKIHLKRKDIQIAQIINKIKQLGKDILFSLDNKYDKLKGDENKIAKNLI